VRSTHAERSGALPASAPSGEGESPGSGDGVSLGSGDIDGSGDSLGSGLSDGDGLTEGSPPEEKPMCGAAFAIVPAIRTAANVGRMNLATFMPLLSAAEAENLEPSIEVGFG
jgi:hypothetical protein